MTIRDVAARPPRLRIDAFPGLLRPCMDSIEMEKHVHD